MRWLLLIVTAAGCGGHPPPAAQLRLDVETLDFGLLASPVDEARTVTVTNAGTQAADVSSVELTGDPAFSIGAHAAHLEPGQARAFVVQFTSSTTLVAEHHGELVFHFAGLPDQRVPVSGTAVFVDCAAPQLVDFGDVLVNDVFHRTFKLINTSGVPTIASFDLQHTGSPDTAAFSIVGGGQHMLAPGESHDVHLTFAPTELRDYVIGATLKTHALCPSSSPRVQGTGVNSIVSCDMLDFDQCPLGRTCVRQLVVRNLLMAPLALSMPTVSPTPEFHLVDDAGMTLTAPPAHRDPLPEGFEYFAGNLFIQVAFAPTHLGTEYGSFFAMTANPKQPSFGCSVVGIGGGPRLDLVPPVVDLGSARSGVFTVKNGGSPGSVLDVYSMIPQSYGVSVGGSPPMGIAAGDQVDVPIFVQLPDAGAPAEWRITLVTNDISAVDAGVTVRAGP